MESIVNKEKILELLKSVNYPGYSRDIISFGIIKDILIEEKVVNFQLFFP